MLVDDTHALMSWAEFDELGEYSLSLPTGTTIGKRWKRDLLWQQRGVGLWQMHVGWSMGEYAESSKPGCVAIVWRRIIIVD